MFELFFVFILQYMVSISSLKSVRSECIKTKHSPWLQQLYNLKVFGYVVCGYFCFCLCVGYVLVLLLVDRSIQFVRFPSAIKLT